jgi:hypothetical protein
MGDLWGGWWWSNIADRWGRCRGGIRDSGVCERRDALIDRRGSRGSRHVGSVARQGRGDVETIIGRWKGARAVKGIGNFFRGGVRGARLMLSWSVVGIF